MNRILVIGRRGSEVAKDLFAGLDAEIEEVRLPASGLRELDATPPDVIVLSDDMSARMVTLCRAIRERPLGQLIPIIIVAEEPQNPSDELDLLGWFAPRETAKMIAAIATELEIPQKIAAPAAQADYVLEEVDDEDIVEINFSAEPMRIKTQDIFPNRLQHNPVEELDASDVKRKLKNIRHEDYFSILEVPRGAETPLIREAFHRQMSRFDHSSVAFEIAHALHAEIDEIRDALEDAWAVLGDSKLRSTYLEKTTRR